MNKITLVKDNKVTVYKAQDLDIKGKILHFNDTETKTLTAIDYTIFDWIKIEPYEEPVYYGVLFDHGLREFRVFSHGERGGTDNYISEVGVTVINNFFDKLEDADLLAFQYNDVRI